jgi:hypothetical protein
MLVVLLLFTLLCNEIISSLIDAIVGTRAGNVYLLISRYVFTTTFLNGGAIESIAV